jgi:hypothetical protein
MVSPAWIVVVSRKNCVASAWAFSRPGGALVSGDPAATVFVAALAPAGIVSTAIAAANAADER